MYLFFFPNFENSFFPQSLIFYICIFGTHCPKPVIFQTYSYLPSRNQSLKYQRSTTSGSKDIGVRKLELVAKTHNP